MGEQKVPGSSLGSFCTREHETPKAPSWTSLAMGPLVGEERNTRFAVWPATPSSLLLLSERGAKRQIQPYRCVPPCGGLVAILAVRPTPDADSSGCDRPCNQGHDDDR